MLFKKVGICTAQAIFQRHACPPAHGVQPTDIHQFPRCPIGLGRIELDCARVADHAPDGLGQLPDGDVRARADIHHRGYEDASG